MSPARFPIFLPEPPKRVTMFGDVVERSEPPEPVKVRPRPVHNFRDRGPALEK